MKAEIYVVPMGIMGQNIMTTIEIRCANGYYGSKHHDDH